MIVPEPDVKARLAAAGVRVPRGTTDLSRAGELRPPLVLKAFGAGIVHKSDVGAVRLGLTHEELPAAAEAMAAALAPDGFLVEEQLDAGIELLVGAMCTPFGLAVVVGLGGVLAEVLDDVAMALAPLDRDGAARLLRSFRAAAVLDGVRGRPPADRGALVDVVLAVTAVAADLGDELEALECNPVIAGPEGAVAVDARLVRRAVAVEVGRREPPTAPLDLDALLAPRTVAVAGASTNRRGFGNRALAAYRAIGRTEGLWAVHPSATHVDGVPAVRSVADVPGGVDYLLAAVPAASCPALVAGAAGCVRVAHVVSGGFAEEGPSGAALESELRAAARSSGVRVIGPNCIGVYAPAGRQAFQLAVPREAGAVAVVSQSGGLAGDIVRAGASRGLRFACVISAGNAVDVTVGELVAALVDRPGVHVIGLYVEGTPGGEELVDALRRARGRLPAVALVGGLSRQGGRAVRSHTGALAVDRRLWSALGAETGLTVIDDLDAFVGVLVHLDRYRAGPVGGHGGVLVLGVGGGASVLATDACDAAGLDVRTLAEATADGLRAVGFGIGTSVTNPIEIGIGPAAADDVLVTALDAVLATEPFDDALVHVNAQAYYGYGTAGCEPLLRQLAAVDLSRWPSTRLTLVVRNLDVAPPADRDRIVAGAARTGVPAYRSLRDAAVAVAATARFHGAVDSNVRST